MAKVRAKFECVGIEDQPENESKSVSFSPVINGSDENKSFSRYTADAKFYPDVGLTGCSYPKAGILKHKTVNKQ